MGRIATELAKRAKAFGMKVIAYDPYVKQSEHAEMKSLDEVLAAADYISLHMPLTDETKGMINADTLAKMKDGVIIVNTGRGKCVDEEAMVKALERGQGGRLRHGRVALRPAARRLPADSRPRAY